MAENLRSLLREAILGKKKLKELPGSEDKKSISAPEHRMVKLLDITINPTFKEAVSLQKRLLKYRDFILTFLHHDKVPPDNNASENAI